MLAILFIVPEHESSRILTSLSAYYHGRKKIQVTCIGEVELG